VCSLEYRKALFARFVVGAPRPVTPRNRELSKAFGAAKEGRGSLGTAKDPASVMLIDLRRPELGQGYRQASKTQPLVLLPDIWFPALLIVITLPFDWPLFQWTVTDACIPF
jgi:hypothetical protein